MVKRTVRQWAAGFGPPLLLALVLPACAHAHATLLGMDPQPGSVAAAGAVRHVKLTFKGAIDLRATRVEVVGSGGSRADTGPPVRVAGRRGVIAVPVRRGLHGS